MVSSSFKCWNSSFIVWGSVKSKINLKYLQEHVFATNLDLNQTTCMKVSNSALHITK